MFVTMNLVQRLNPRCAKQFNPAAVVPEGTCVRGVQHVQMCNCTKAEAVPRP